MGACNPTYPIPWIFVALLAAGTPPISPETAAQAQENPSRPQPVRVGLDTDPDEDARERRLAQMATVVDFEVFHSFRFRDLQPQSGIDFVHRVTEDSGKHYKPNHYDHGNGVVVADVDGDNLYDVYLVSQLGSNGLFKNLGGGKSRT